MGARPQRLSFLGRFVLLSAVLMVGIGSALAFVLHDRIERRALRDAERTVSAVARVGIWPQLRPSDLLVPPDAQRTRELDVVLGDVVKEDAGLVHANVYGPDGRVVWSDDTTAATASRPGDAALVSALAGRVVSSVERGAADDRRDAKLLEVYVPLRRRPGGPAEGAFEAYLPYGPVAGAIRDDTILVVAAVALGLLVLCASLFRLVARASRRLRR
ncbi:MAG TPA: hypothetical protein VLA98_06275, partial [Solirubrobacteraceae bacterium]|nr:hypothetical protein [Solirubrobacteraceae bacterium]